MEMTASTLKAMVCGGRDFDDRELLFFTLDSIQAGPWKIRHLIHGAYRGADRLADEWAKSRGVDVTPYPADWEGRGPRAGPERNTRMVNEGKPHLVIDFPGDTGTADATRKAVGAGAERLRVRSRDPVLTRSKIEDNHWHGWHIYFAGVNVGIMSERSGNPPGTDAWQWHCGFHFGGGPGTQLTGTSGTEEQARVEFQKAWQKYQPNIPVGAFDKARADAAVTAAKYACFKFGIKIAAQR